MSDQICFLVTILSRDNSSLLRCALRFHRDSVDEEVIEFPMEFESRDVLRAMLPLHVRNSGPIVGVEEIFEVHIHG